MGLAASQARLLTLTSRQHAIEYKAQKLEAEKLQLANDSDQVYNTYLNALDATKVQYRYVNLDGSTSYTLLTTLIQEGYVVVMEKNPEASEYYKFDPASGKLSFADGIDTQHKWDYTIKNGEGGTKLLKPGEKVSTTVDGNAQDVDVYEEFFKVFGDTSVSTSTKLQEVSDELGLKKAEAQYEADMNKINKKDTRFDTELAQLETERNAIKEEIESLKNVAKENVDRTFKIFT